MLKYLLAFIPLVGTTIGAILGVSGNNKRIAEKEGVLVAVATGVLCSVAFNLTLELCEIVSTFTPSNILSVWGASLVGILVSRAMNSFTTNKNFTTRDKVFWAMLIHNIPEGMVIGITLADSIVLPQTKPLLASISLQNIPDGLVVSMPLMSTKGKSKALQLGIISGTIEPLIAIIIVIATRFIPNIQVIEPFLIAFSFIIISWILIELFKECKNYRLIAIITAIIAISINTVL